MSKKQSPERSSYNIVTLSTLVSKEKPNNTFDYQYLSNSTVVKVTPTSFAQAIDEGHSFHTGVYKPNKKGTFTNKGIMYANVFAIDIDHHNFTVEEILERCVVKPNVIYKTHSYTEENKRYRVVFFADTTISTKTEKELHEVVKQVNIALTAPFVQNLPEEVLAFSDLVAVNAGRLFFGGKEVVYLEEDSRFCLQALLSNKKLLEQSCVTWGKASLAVKEHRRRKNRIDKFRTYVPNKSWEKYELIRKDKTPEAFHYIKDVYEKLAEKVEVNAPGIKARKKNGKTVKPVCDSADRPLYADLIQMIKDALPNYRVAEAGETLFMDYDEAINLVRMLPLHEIFGYELEKPFIALLRTDDNNPSTVFLQSEDDAILYYDFASQATLSAFDFITTLMTVEYGYIAFETLTEVCEALGVRITSQYQLMAKEQLEYSFNTIVNILEGQRKHEIKGILGYGLGRTYLGLNLMARSMVPRSSLLESRQGVVVFKEITELHGELLKGYWGDVSKMKINSYDSFFKKLSMLVYLGFIEKTDPTELTEETQVGLTVHRSEMKIKKDLTDATYRYPNFYEFMVLTPELLTMAVERYEKYEEAGGLRSTMTHSTLCEVNKDEAKRVFPQNHKKKDGDRDVVFYVAIIRQANKLLKKQGYFTENELLDNILQKHEWFNGKYGLLERYEKAHKEKPRTLKEVSDDRKRKALKKVRPKFLKELDLKCVKPAKVSDSIKLNKDITHRHHVYVKTSNVK